MPQPLSGLLVLDFTTLLPGPLATLMLAEAGAEVIKIERPGGEDMRALSAALATAHGAAFALLNRGKSSLDARSQERRRTGASFMPLLERADILVEQFRPGVMERLGFGYDDVRADQSAADLLLDHRLRPERAARAGGRARPQLHRQYRAAGAAAGPGRPPGGAAGAGRRHRRRHVSRR